MPIYGKTQTPLADYEFNRRVMDLWRTHGGGQHGPMVETVTMPLDNFIGFTAALRSLVESEAVSKMTAAERDVSAERRRQVEVEGWTAEHDDVEHADGQLARAAGCYAAVAGQGKGYEYHVDRARRGWLFGDWPWHSDWWKPTTPRRDLVKAAALALAEIERIDRASARAVHG